MNEGGLIYLLGLHRKDVFAADTMGCWIRCMKKKPRSSCGLSLLLQMSIREISALGVLSIQGTSGCMEFCSG